MSKELEALKVTVQVFKDSLYVAEIATNQSIRLRDKLAHAYSLLSAKLTEAKDKE